MISLARGATDSLSRWTVGSLWFVSLLFHWVVEFRHWFTDPLVHCFIASFIQLCSDSFTSFHWASEQPSAHSLIHLTTATLHGFCIVKAFLHRPLISYSHVLFSKLPPRPNRAPGRRNSRWSESTHQWLKVFSQDHTELMGTDFKMNICSEYLWPSFEANFMSHVCGATREAMQAMPAVILRVFSAYSPRRQPGWVDIDFFKKHLCQRVPVCKKKSKQHPSLWIQMDPNGSVFIRGQHHGVHGASFLTSNHVKSAMDRIRADLASDVQTQMALWVIPIQSYLK